MKRLKTVATAAVHRVVRAGNRLRTHAAFARKQWEKKNETQEQGAMTEIVFSRDPHPQGIVFRMGGKEGLARFAPYGWLSFCEYEIAGRTLKVDFSRYDVILRAAENHSLETLFAAIAKNECSEVAQKAGATIEVIEKEES